MLQTCMVMDRRRLEDRYLLLATLEVIAKHDLPISAMPCDRNKMIEMITEPYKQPPLQNGDTAWKFSKKLSDIGMSIQKYIECYNMENDER